MKSVVPLVDAREEALYGAKAVGLGDATRAGLPIPPGVAVSGEMVDAIVEVTETGSTLRAHGLRIICDLFSSTPQLIANRAAWGVAWKREKIEQIGLLLAGALRAEARVGLKMNVPPEKLEEVIALLPAITAPTVSPLYGTGWFAVESVIAEATVRDLIPRLLRTGAVGIIEYPLNKIVG